MTFGDAKLRVYRLKVLFNLIVLSLLVSQLKHEACAFSVATDTNTDSISSTENIPTLAISIAPTIIPYNNIIPSLSLDVNNMGSTWESGRFSLLLSPYSHVELSNGSHPARLVPTYEPLVKVVIQSTSQVASEPTCNYISVQGMKGRIQCREVDIVNIFAPRTTILGAIVQTNSQNDIRNDSSIIWKPAFVLTKSYFPTDLKLPQSDQQFTIEGWGFEKNATTRAFLMGPIGTQNTPYMRVGSLECRSDENLGWQLTCGVPPLTDTAVKMQKYPGMYRVYLRTGEVNVIEKDAINWAIMVPLLAENQISFSKTDIGKKPLLIYGFGLRGPQTSISVNLSSGICSSTVVYEASFPASAELGPWVINCNISITDSPQLGPIKANVIVTSFNLVMETPSVQVAEIVLPPKLNAIQYQSARLVTDGHFTIMGENFYRRNPAKNEVTLLNNDASTKCIGTFVSEDAKTLECVVPNSRLPFQVGTIILISVSANGVSYTLRTPVYMGYARERPVISQTTFGILRNAYPFSLTISGSNFVPAFMNGGRSYSIQLWHRAANKSGFIEGPTCSATQIKDSYIACTPAKPFSEFEPIYASLSIDGIDDVVTYESNGSNKTLVAVVRERPQIVASNAIIEYEFNGHVKIYGHYFSGNKKSNKVTLFPSGSCEVVNAYEGFPLIGDPSTLSWIECVISNASRGSLFASITVDDLSQSNPMNTTQIGYIIKYPVVASSTRSQPPNQGYILLHGEGFSLTEDNFVELSRSSCIHPPVALSEQLLNCTFSTPTFPLDGQSPYSLRVIRITSGNTTSRFTTPQVVATIRVPPKLTNASITMRKVGEEYSAQLAIEGTGFALENEANTVILEPGGYKCVTTNTTESTDIINTASQIVCELTAAAELTAGDYTLDVIVQEGVKLQKPFPISISPIVFVSDILGNPYGATVPITTKTFELQGLFFTQKLYDVRVYMRVVPLNAAIPYILNHHATSMSSPALLDDPRFSFEDNSASVVPCEVFASSRGFVQCDVPRINNQTTGFNQTGVLMAQLTIKDIYRSQPTPIALLAPVINRNSYRVTTSASAIPVTISGVGFWPSPELLNVTFRLQPALFADSDSVTCQVINATREDILCTLPPRMTSGPYVASVTVNLGTVDTSSLAQQQLPELSNNSSNSEQTKMTVTVTSTEELAVQIKPYIEPNTDLIEINITNNMPSIYQRITVHGLGFDTNISRVSVQLSSSDCLIVELQDNLIVCLAQIRLLQSGNLYAIVQSNYVDSNPSQIATIKVHRPPAPSPPPPSVTPTKPPRESPSCSLPFGLCEPAKLTSGLVAGIICIIVAVLGVIVGLISLWLRKHTRYLLSQGYRPLNNDSVMEAIESALSDEIDDVDGNFDTGLQPLDNVFYSSDEGGRESGDDAPLQPQ